MTLCVGVDVATKGSASDIRATLVKIGGMMMNELINSVRICSTISLYHLLRVIPMSDQ